MNRFKTRAKGHHKPGVMNKTEAAYAKALEIEKQAGLVAWYAFESIKFKLAKKTFYTPDFIVMRSDGSIEVHEVKGFWQDDAKVKIKVASEKFPFKFIAVKQRAKKNGGGWEVENY